MKEDKGRHSGSPPQWGGSGQICASDVPEIGSVLARLFPGKSLNDSTIPLIACLF